jgi:long-chain acyl-CoA synthetase
MPETTATTIAPPTRTIADLAARAAASHGPRSAIRHRRDGEWVEQSFAELGQTVEELAQGLVALGIDAGDRVCILANTRPEWTYASLAISSVGGVVVPIYPTNSPEECEWVAGNSEAKAVVCENSEQLAKIALVRSSLPALEHSIAIDPDGADGAIGFDALRTRGREVSPEQVQARSHAVTPEDPYTFIYTSGTTGPPKGCVITHANCLPLCTLPRDIGLVSNDDDAYLYLPLAHVFALTTQLGAMEMGSTIVYFGGDTRNIIGELGETHPTYLPSVPRIFEKLYTAATAQVDRATPEERKQFEQAVKVGLEVRRREARGEEVPDELRKPFEQADEKIFKHVRALFGGRIRYAVTGAAPIAPEILEFFYACGVTVLEGWGMTETTGAGCLNLPDALKFGTVGRPLPGFEVRTADDGEIEARGALVFKGYWRNPEATKSVFTDDGWLRTGDLGEIDDEGFLKITGRKKDIIITAGGKNLTPANIENDLQQSRWISRAVMYGDRRPYPVALITLDAEEILPWAKEQGLPADIPSLAENGKVVAMVQAELDRANERYARVEQIKKFRILDHDFTQEAGELTPTLKLKRNVVYDKYADVFDSIYNE